VSILHFLLLVFNFINLAHDHLHLLVDFFPLQLLKLIGIGTLLMTHHTLHLLFDLVDHIIGNLKLFTEYFIICPQLANILLESVDDRL